MRKYYSIKEATSMIVDGVKDVIDHSDDRTQAEILGSFDAWLGYYVNVVCKHSEIDYYLDSMASANAVKAYKRAKVTLHKLYGITPQRC